MMRGGQVYSSSCNQSAKPAGAKRLKFWTMPSDEGALRGRGCLVIDRQGRVLLGCGCGHADTALFPRRLVRYAPSFVPANP